LITYGDSIFMTHKDDKNTVDDSHEICEFRLNPEGQLCGRPVVKTDKYCIIRPAGVEFFLKKLTPYVEWYLRQSTANVSQFPVPQETKTSLAA